LTRLQRLTHLSLKDPQSIPNPLCLLYNYYIHVIYHMPHLQCLDTYDVSSKHLKDFAEVRECVFYASENVSCLFRVDQRDENYGNVYQSTVMKKIMYYTMRVRYAQRQFDDLKAKLNQQRRDQTQLPEERIRVLAHMLRTVSIYCVQTGTMHP